LLITSSIATNTSRVTFVRERPPLFCPFASSIARADRSAPRKSSDLPLALAVPAGMLNSSSSLIIAGRPTVNPSASVASSSRLCASSMIRWLYSGSSPPPIARSASSSAWFTTSTCAP
jgi:hypothetical protein